MYAPKFRSWMTHEERMDEQIAAFKEAESKRIDMEFEHSRHVFNAELNLAKKKFCPPEATQIATTYEEALHILYSQYPRRLDGMQALAARQAARTFNNSHLGELANALGGIGRFL